MKKATLLFISFFSLIIWSGPGFSQVYLGGSSQLYQFEKAQAMRAQAIQFQTMKAMQEIAQSHMQAIKAALEKEQPKP